MHKRTTVLLSAALILALMVFLAGCGNTESTEPATNTNETTAEQSAENEQTNEPTEEQNEEIESGEEPAEEPEAEPKATFDLSPYEALESDRVVIIFDDGTEEAYSGGKYDDNSGTDGAFWAVNDAYEENAVKAKAKYEGATIVVKAPITMIDDSEPLIIYPTSAWIGLGTYGTNMSRTEVTTPQIYVRNGEETILELDLDEGDEILIAGPLRIEENGNHRFLILDDIYAVEAV